MAAPSRRDLKISEEPLKTMTIANRSGNRRHAGPHLRASCKLGSHAYQSPRGTFMYTQRLLDDLDIQQVEIELQSEELRTVRAELEASVERYRELFELAPIGYATLDKQLRLCELNQAAARLLGRDRSSLRGTAFNALVSSADVPRLDLALVLAARAGARQRFAVSLHTGKAVCISVAKLDSSQMLLAMQEVNG